MTDQRHSGPDHGGRDQYKRHVDGDISVRGKIEIHPPPDTIKEDKAEREDQRSNRNKHFIVSFWTLVAVAIYAGITFWQGCMTRTLIDNTSKQFQRDQRPYIWYSGSFDASGLHIAEGDRLWVNIHWVNYGRSPALRGVATTGAFFGPDATNKVNAWFDSLGNSPLPYAPTTPEIVIPPGVPSDPVKTFGGFSTIESSEPLNADAVNYIKTTNEPIALAIRFQYYDGYGNRYWSDLCLSRFKNGAIPHCRKHNEMH